MFEVLNQQRTAIIVYRTPPGQQNHTYNASKNNMQIQLKGTNHTGPGLRNSLWVWSSGVASWVVHGSGRENTQSAGFSSVLLYWELSKNL